MADWDPLSSTEPESQSGLLARPMFQLRSLPIPVRWEVTRRHPYYLTFWDAARDHYRQVPPTDERERLWRLAAVAGLAMIGVSSEPPDPATPFESLEAAQLRDAWLSGAVQPVTMRALAALLISGLPKSTLGKVALTMLRAACEDDDPEEMPHQIEGLLQLQALDLPDLDASLDEPLVSVNPAASGRQLREALEAELTRWKAERDLGEQRDRSDKYSEYLAVWDLREGWAERDYDPRREQTLREVAQQRQELLSTVNRHYRRAFELITGYPYSPALWMRLFGLHKSFLFGFPASRVSLRRPLKSPTPRPVPESVLGVNLETLSGGSVFSHAEQAVADVMMDLETLIRQGLTDEEIRERLELSPEAPEVGELLAYMRGREELLESSPKK